MSSARNTMNRGPRENNLFEEVEMGAGDQSMFGFVDNLFGSKKEAT